MDFIGNLQLKKKVPRRHVQEQTIICLHTYHGLTIKKQTSYNREAECVRKKIVDIQEYNT